MSTTTNQRPTILGCIPRPHRHSPDTLSTPNNSPNSNLSQIERQKLWRTQQQSTQVRYENLTLMRVKIILRDVTFFLEQNKLLEVTGIYRRGPLMTKKNEFKTRINKDRRDIHIDLQDWIDQPHTLTACLKDLLRELDEPLLLRGNYERIVGIGKKLDYKSISKTTKTGTTTVNSTVNSVKIPKDPKKIKNSTKNIKSEKTGKSVPIKSVPTKFTPTESTNKSDFQTKTNLPDQTKPPPITDEEFSILAREVIDSMPKKNHEVFEILLEHLVQVVLCENSNSMSTLALSIIWSPCIIKPKEGASNEQDLLAMTSNQNYCTYFLRKILDIKLKEKENSLKSGSSIVSSLSRLARTNSNKSNSGSSLKVSRANSDHGSSASKISRKSTCASECSGSLHHDKLSVSDSVKFAQQVCDSL